MRLSTCIITTMIALPVVGQPAQAQHYVRSWNTSIVAAPAISTRLITNSLPAATAPTGPGIKQSSPHAMAGIASYYWQDQMTSSGERFDKHAMTAAHRTLPMHTRVKVTHIESGRSVVVRINDRGPFKPGRIIDLSDGAAAHLGFKPKGLAHVRLDILP